MDKIKGDEKMKQKTYNQKTLKEFIDDISDYWDKDSDYWDKDFMKIKGFGDEE